MVLMGWVLDLDGVLWLGDMPIEGSAKAVEMLRRSGEEVVFVTNNSYARRGDVAAKLQRHGIEAGDDVITSAMAVTSLVEPGERVLVCGGPGVVEAVEEGGGEIVPMPLDDPGGVSGVDLVVVGYHPEFDYRRMWAGATAVRGGARLLGTNLDSTYPTPQGQAPGGGAILSAIETASGHKATIVGKPFRPIVDLVLGRIGPDGIAVGDRPETDGEFARALGYRFGLVLSGVTPPREKPAVDITPSPNMIAPDLLSLVNTALGNI